ncbi:PilW family protein [Noviherbaspirillum aridicola]|uniref:Type IV pilus assembly protein PilW n=1 Tax=Noviherbaspirillum aridicola TaxID=2849687 RepID=A0ABQ4PZZ4_9BURK|nr:PilW family protein [Noviherbaspirillum aridicola]GIZ50424.1 hypothetical protein NCCP691_04380 [Noviherbaspirillum aridicola]
MRAPAPAPAARNAGFGLVEAMVGLAIALVATLVISQVFSVFEGQRRSTTGGSDAQTEAALAAYAIERDLRMAGYGMNLLSALGCTVRAEYDGERRDFVLTPLSLSDGAGGLPDALNIVSSNKQAFSAPARIITDHPETATNFFVNTVLGIAVGDMMIAWEPNKDCTLFQVTGIPNGKPQLHHQNTSPWNPTGAAAADLYPDDGYKTGALLFNLGSMRDRSFSLDAGMNLVVADVNSATGTAAEQRAYSNIVSLQAQYGFDTRPGVQADSRVTNWSSTMVDADGDGVVGNGGDLQRIYAVRFAVVARNAVRELRMVDGACNVTTEDSANAPRWAGGAIDVSRNPDGSANAQWRCYRYHVVENTVPLRNLLWRDS